jgi:hypothetical protein
MMEDGQARVVGAGANLKPGHGDLAKECNPFHNNQQHSLPQLL